MYLSPREKQLLAEFLSSPSPVSIQKMMNLLKVSKRTIYRELDNLEVSLKSVNASLKKAARGSFVIEASEEVLEQLKENTDGKSNDLSTAKRQHA
ncbi:TPA: HTH domain-containing protein, partial [Enterococcus faecium]|nr:HTH domain-containing protein [Enterococcus faecium]